MRASEQLRPPALCQPAVAFPARFQTLRFSNSMQEKERELQQQLMQVPLPDLTRTRLSLMSNSSATIAGARCARVDGQEEPVRGAVAALVRGQGVGEVRFLKGFRLPSCKAPRRQGQRLMRSSKQLARSLWVTLVTRFPFRLKAELEQRERRLKEQVSSLSEKLSRGETGAKDSMSTRKSADKGTVPQPQPLPADLQKPQTP
jgi:hypothetical protein